MANGEMFIARSPTVQHGGISRRRMCFNLMSICGQTARPRAFVDGHDLLEAALV